MMVNEVSNFCPVENDCWTFSTQVGITGFDKDTFFLLRAVNSPPVPQEKRFKLWLTLSEKGALAQKQFTRHI